MAEGLSAILAPDFSFDGILAVPAAPTRTARMEDVYRRASGAERSEFRRRPRDSRSSRAVRRTHADLLPAFRRRFIACRTTARSRSDARGFSSSFIPRSSPAALRFEEINAIRKHLSATKGGRLAAAAPRSMKLTFGVSDVPEGHESALGSGPTLPDPTTIDDAERVAREYDLLPKMSAISSRCLRTTCAPGNSQRRRPRLRARAF